MKDAGRYEGLIGIAEAKKESLQGLYKGGVIESSGMRGLSCDHPC